jgi:hypothetical protein
MKRTAIPILALVAISLVACTKHGTPTGQALENQQQSQGTESLVNNQPLPHFNYSQLRQNLIEIETAEATGVQTTSFFFNHGIQDPIFTCPSIGVPIPNTMSLSNPQQVVHDGYPSGGAALTVNQMDPNGVYTPPSSSGTFVMCVGANGKPFAKYWEGHVDAVFAPARWDQASHTVQIIGPASFNFTKTKTP